MFWNAQGVEMCVCVCYWLVFVCGVHLHACSRTRVPKHTPHTHHHMTSCVQMEQNDASSLVLRRVGLHTHSLFPHHEQSLYLNQS